jgi:hypothetical protein
LQRVDVAVLLGRDSDAEMEVRHGPLRFSGPADRADRSAFFDGGVLLRGDRAEVDHRDRVPVVGLDGHAQPVARCRSGEGHLPTSRCRHRLPCGAADVDSAVLATRVRIGAERKRAEDRAGCRPRPGACGRSDDQARKSSEKDCSQERQHHRRS